MLKFALKHMAVHLGQLCLNCLSIALACCVALLSYNISTQVSDGIVQSASRYDLIVGPAGSSTQLAMNTLFFTDQPLGTMPYSVLEEIEASGLANEAVPFSMGDSYNDAPIVGTSAALLDGRALASGEMFSASGEVVLGWDVARRYGLEVGEQIVSAHGLDGDGHAHAESPLTVVGVLERTHSAFDSAVFTPCETIWALHGAGESEREICAVLVRTKNLQAYASLSAAYSEDANYLAINPNTVLREVLENVDLSRQIVYILCALILLMNLFAVALLAALNTHSARPEIRTMRLIGVSMRRVGGLYLLQNALTALLALGIAISAKQLCLLAIRGFVARMGIILSAGRVYPAEGLIALAVLILSMLPTALTTLRLARRDGAER